MKFRLTDRDAIVNDYIYYILEGNRMSCRSCILNGVSDLSKKLYKLIENKGIDTSCTHCSQFDSLLEKLGYEKINKNATGCMQRQNQALALYLLMSKPKEKRK